MSKLLSAWRGIQTGGGMPTFVVGLVVATAGLARGGIGPGLGAGSASCTLAETSALTVLGTPLPQPPPRLSGAIDISADEQGRVRCDLVEVAPVDIVAIGFVCMSPPVASVCGTGIANCPAEGLFPCVGDCDASGDVDVSELVVGTHIALGLVDDAQCRSLDVGEDGVAIEDIVGAVGNAIDGCPGLGIDLITDFLLGDCTSNEDCLAQCDSYCADMDKIPTESGCAGFCAGGKLDGEACTLDSQCVEGRCNGPDTVPFGNICGCQCIDYAAGDPPSDGDLSCVLGASLTVEPSLPCGDGDAFSTISTWCVPLTTTTTQSISTSSNGICYENGAICRFDVGCGERACADPTNPRLRAAMVTGTAGQCSAIASGSFSGFELRGYGNFFGSSLGNLVFGISLDCL